MRRGKKNDESKGTSAWDKRAGHFNRKVSGEDGSARTNTIIKFLRDEGVLHPGMKIIDVGSGPGSVTLLLAEKAGEVYALDPAVKMLTILEEKAKTKGINNVHTVQARWQDIDLKEKGWEDAFDLSFASMTPGVDDPESLQKLMDSSRKYCYLSTFAGRIDKAREELWQMLTGHPFQKKDLDIIYPFNLLYSWGYRPSLRFYRHYGLDFLPLEESVEELMQSFHIVMEVDSTVKNKISNYVTGKLQNNLFPYEREIYHGMLIWDKTVVFKLG